MEGVKGSKIWAQVRILQILGCKSVEYDRKVPLFRREWLPPSADKIFFGIPKLITLFYIQGSSSITDQKFGPLTFRHRASYIQDDRSANLQMLYFIYLFNKYKY
jgi:hypothetical protein